MSELTGLVTVKEKVVLLRAASLVTEMGEALVRNGQGGTKKAQGMGWLVYSLKRVAESKETGTARIVALAAAMKVMAERMKAAGLPGVEFSKARYALRTIAVERALGNRRIRIVG